MNNIPIAPIKGTFNSFVNAYAVDRVNVKKLIKFLMSANFIDNVALLFSQPVENIIALRYYPFDISTIYSGWASKENININIVTTNAQGNKLFSSLPIINLGRITVPSYYNNFLDYAPYTKYELYLPYIGFVQLDNTTVAGNDLSIDYAIDILTGKCQVFITLITNVNGVESKNIIMTLNGTIGIDVQIGGGQTSEIARNLLKLGLSTLGGTTSMGTLAVGAIDAMQVHVEKGGVIYPSTALYSPQHCYLIITRPRVAMPSSYDKNYGRPLNETKQLNDLSGYTQIDDVHMEGFATATDNEVKEIETLLKEGVIL